MHLLNARRPNGVRVLDFRNLRTLSVVANNNRDLMAIQAFIRVTEKLETLIYVSTYRDPAMAHHTSLTILASFALPRKYFPWLSSNIQVTFKFSANLC